MVEVIIDYDRCVRCLECVDVCPTDAIIAENGKPIVKDSNLCIACLSCSYVCRADAIIHRDIHIEKRFVVNVKIEEKIKKFF